MLSCAAEPGALTRLPMSVADGKTMGRALALSPDGTRLAIAIAPGGGIRQVSSCTRSAVRRPYLVRHGRHGRRPVRTGSLSWTQASQRTLAVKLVGQAPTRSVRLLDLDVAGGSLLAASRPAVDAGQQGGEGADGVPMRGHDPFPGRVGDRLCRQRDHEIGKDGIIRYSTGFPEFSAATGRSPGSWGTGTGPRASGTIRRSFDVLWSDASGRVLIGVVNSAGRNWVGVISGNKFTPLSAQWAPCHVH